MRARSIAKLANMLHPPRARHKPLALLRAYCDGGGSHADADIVLIAGFVAPASLWAGIESDSLSTGLAGVIAKHRPTAVTAAISRAEWDRFKAGGGGEKFKDPYRFCFEDCMRKIASWSQAAANGEAVAAVFAEQADDSSHAGRIYALHRNSPRWGREIASVTFASARNYAALQAADLIAYETYRQVLARQENAATPIGSMRPMGAIGPEESFDAPGNLSRAA